MVCDSKLLNNNNFLVKFLIENYQEDDYSEIVENKIVK